MFLLLALLLNSLLTLGFTATLPKEEVDALRRIGETLGKRDWNFNVEPCSNDSSWKTANRNDTYRNVLNCNCTYENNTLCHVTSISLRGQNLPGILPPELIRLPFLQEINLTLNFLNGTIPVEWASLPLVKISLFANRLSGAVPKEFGSITTLRSLNLESNRFSERLPPELGHLVNLERLLISSNEFVGELPATFSNLINLKVFRVSDNNFSGRIPTFIQYWTQLMELEIQASGLTGPIPFQISPLKNLTDMRISDVSGPASPFPLLSTQTEMDILILRNCNLVGTIPDFVGDMAIKTLDLSFNKLNGKIPSSFGTLVKSQHFKFMYLTSNLLTGLIPAWVHEQSDKDENYIDLSYNNFTTSDQEYCQLNNNKVNLFGSSAIENNSIIKVSCVKSYQCPQTSVRPFLYINCGGPQVTINETRYEADEKNVGPSYYSNGGEDWAIINTGYFLDEKDNYLATNTSTLSENASQLYMTARLSPLALTYYGFCLENGNYTVQLHFAEIIFKNDNTFYSTGKRVFNVYIQGKLVLSDFNIENVAHGTGKAVLQIFHDVVVTNNGLEIRLIWAGKGTSTIPFRGAYGPLISAISVTNKNFTPFSSDRKRKKLSAFSIAGIVFGVVGIFLVLGFLWWKGCLQGKPTRHPGLIGLDLQTGSFTLKQINAATNYFDIANKIGEGGFGPVYKGLLSDGTIIAVKQLSSKSKQGNREFVNEIGMISALQHPNLAKLFGCCIEGDQLLLIYEYMENNSLARALWGPEESRLKLDWPTRHKICVGIARGLTYLHEESRLKIVHRDIKATNVLLDKDLNPKISDFGIAKLDEEDATHISTRIAGTYGYMAPEYAMRGYLTDKADVYSFGIVALEIVSGKCNSNYRPKEEGFYLLDWVHFLHAKRTLVELIDPNLGSEFNKEEVMGMINVALLCTNTSSTARPTMSAVVSMLEGHVVVQEVPSDPSYSSEKLMSNAMISNLQYSNTQTQTESEIQSQSTSVNVPWTRSSTSANDLYPINLDSEYWNKRV